MTLVIHSWDDDLPWNAANPEPIPAERDVVLTEDLAPALNRWLQKALASHRRTWGANDSVKPSWSDGHTAHTQPFTPLARLALETGIDARRIYGVINQEFASMGLDQADTLLLGIDETVSSFDTYKSRDVTAAVKEQNELLRNIARANGQYVPAGQRNAQTTVARLRKSYLKAA